MNNHENIIAGNSDPPLIRYSAASMMEFSWKYEHYGGWTFFQLWTTVIMIVVMMMMTMTMIRPECCPLAWLLPTGNDKDYDDIYIMMKCLSVCLSVTKNHHFHYRSVNNERIFFLNFFFWNFFLKIFFLNFFFEIFFENFFFEIFFSIFFFLFNFFEIFFEKF